jgi:3'-phosphoadenosine 5'-phosphosulfate sulfotransferase (PAPS reductase)/FAD synthetase
MTFCDTGNEDRLTYEHLQMLNDTVAVPAGIVGGIEWLKPEYSFFELAFKKKRFPSRKAQFCTQWLKLRPTQEWIRQRMNEGHEVIVLNGKRTAESAERGRSMKGHAEREWSPFWGCEEWAPLMTWKIEDVLAIHKRYGISLNPLYALGAHRVGCFPCINCGKREIRLVAKHRPEKILQIAEWERKVGEHRQPGEPCTFFEVGTTTKNFRDAIYHRKKDGKTFSTASIDAVVKWAMTERGGKQYRIPFEEVPACWMNYGACE